MIWAPEKADPLTIQAPFKGIYFPQEEGTCCIKRVKQKPGTSSGLVKPFHPWMNPATPRQLSIVASAGDGSAQRTPRMKTGTLAPSSRAKKAARVKIDLALDTK